MNKQVTKNQARKVSGVSFFQLMEGRQTGRSDYWCARIAVGKARHGKGRNDGVVGGRRKKEGTRRLLLFVGRHMRTELHLPLPGVNKSPLRLEKREKYRIRTTCVFVGHLTRHGHDGL